MHTYAHLNIIYACIWYYFLIFYALIFLYDLLINTRYFNVYIEHDKHDDNCLKSSSAHSSSKSSPESSNSVSIVSTKEKTKNLE